MISANAQINPHLVLHIRANVIIEETFAPMHAYLKFEAGCRARPSAPLFLPGIVLLRPEERLSCQCVSFEQSLHIQPVLQGRQCVSGCCLSLFEASPRQPPWRLSLSDTTATPISSPMSVSLRPA